MEHAGVKYVKKKKIIHMEETKQKGLEMCQSRILPVKRSTDSNSLVFTIAKGNGKQILQK